MLEGLLGAGPAIWVHLQQALEEVEELGIFSSNPIAKRCLFGNENVVQSIFLEEDKIFFAEIVRHLRASLKHPLRPRSEDALHAC